MTWTIIKTQAELDAALEMGSGNLDIRFQASFRVRTGRWVIKDSAHVVARGSARVVARGSARVEAWGSARVEAWGSARVEARDSAHVVARDSAHVVARDSAHVVARDSAHVVAWGSALVRLLSGSVQASAGVVVLRHNPEAKCIGGQVIEQLKPKTILEWCDYQGASLDGDVVTLYKALDDDFATRISRKAGIFYTPGSEPKAPDWDGGAAECGGGLHACAHPEQSAQFNSGSKRFIACPVRISDIAFHKNAIYPEKVKFRAVCAPVYEVDRRGKPIEATQ
jgi:hypothetical protein